MLVLTRKIGESIRIGEDVTVHVLSVRGGQVRIGVAAPNDVRIFREEILRTVSDHDGDGSAGDDDRPVAPAREYGAKRR
jgi:carbon storage regulator